MHDFLPYPVSYWTLLYRARPIIVNAQEINYFEYKLPINLLDMKLELTLITKFFVMTALTYRPCVPNVSISRMIGTLYYNP